VYTESVTSYTAILLFYGSAICKQFTLFMETRVCEACYRVVFALPGERIGAAWAGCKAVELSVNSQSRRSPMYTILNYEIAGLVSFKNTEKMK